MQNWDFNCPQFVDFQDGLHNDLPTDIWSGSFNRDGKKDTLFKGNVDFGPRMATPKLKFNPFHPLRKSRTLDHAVDHLKTPEKNVKSRNARRKRSFSENCNKVIKRYPTTPQCLKRTLYHVKSKKNCKTTEELEMEKISELQNELMQRLKLNEINLKRIKMNKAPVSIKTFQSSNCNRHLKVVETKDLNVPVQQLAGAKILSKKAKIGEENTDEKHKTHKQNLKMKLIRLNAVLHPENKKPAVPSNALRDLNSNDDNGKVSLKKIPSALYHPHSGLKFLPNQSKTIPHPFSFDSSCASSQSMSFRLKETSKVLPSSTRTPTITNKENINIH